MQNLRRVVQVLVFVAFVYLFVLTVGRYDPAVKRIVLTSAAPIDTFFRMDPLLGLAAMVSTGRIIGVMLLYGLPIVLLTVLAGRFFCGWVCPLGTALDATDVLFFRRRKVRPSPQPSPSQGERVSGASPSQGQGEGSARVKHYILAAILIAAVFSAQVAFIADPITIITRAFTFAAFPVVQLGFRSLVGFDFVRDNVPFVSQNPYVSPDVQYFFRLNFLASAMLIAILAANAISRRYWCRTLCPLGALLALISRFAAVRRIVAANCTNCARCVPDCKMGAIMPDPAHYRASECIYCYNCTTVCPSLSTKIVPALGSKGYHAQLDLNRRRVLQAFGIGALVAVLGKTNAAAKASRTGKIKVSSELLIRPPGALPEEEFINRCIRCSECMKVCPTGGLQPALTEAGIAGLWTPVLVPGIGECAQNCNLCSQVCSSQAIQPFEIAEKPHIYIGRAVIDRSACIAWNSNKQCLVCDEACSYRAVYWQSVEGARRPFVEEHKCVGCGICENVCPIQPVAAIRSFSFGDQRYKSREEQRQFFERGLKTESPRKEG